MQERCLFSFNTHFSIALRTVQLPSLPASEIEQRCFQYFNARKKEALFSWMLQVKHILWVLMRSNIFKRYLQNRRLSESPYGP